MIKDIDKKSKELAKLLDEFAEHLPAGYTIQIQMERHGGSVDLVTHDGRRIGFPSNCECFGRQVYEAYEGAVQYAAESKVQP